MLSSALLTLVVLAGHGLTNPLSSKWGEQKPIIPDPDAGNLTLLHDLMLAPTAADRLALLQPDDFVFDFNVGPAGSVVQGKGGRTVRADRKTFPALVGSGGSMTVGFLGPCGFNTPHVHPRGTEINIIVQGMLFTSFTAENGAPNISHNLTQYQMTVFPEGALHTEFNPTCDDAVFVAAFPSEDPGVQQAAQTFFGLEDGLITAALGGGITVAGEDLDKFRRLIPANVALGVDSCLSKCGIKKTLDDNGGGKKRVPKGILVGDQVIMSVEELMEILGETEVEL